MPAPNAPPPPLLSLRAAVVLLFAAVVGAGAGTVNYIENGPASARPARRLSVRRRGALAPQDDRPVSP
jgi:hypothetical protein